MMSARTSKDTATAGDIVRELAASFRDAGIASPMLDARLIVARACAIDAHRPLIQPDLCVSPAQLCDIRRCQERRLAHEPVSRILGSREFWGQKFAISPATLDPRADSETLVTACLDIARREGWLNQPVRILDLGTGSGCLLLSLLHELASGFGVGTDISEAAIRTARENAKQLGVGERAQFVRTDWANGIDGCFHITVANPPYIARTELDSLSPEVRLYDPMLALDGGDDGRDAYRAILASLAGRAGVHTRWIVFEVGAAQCDAVIALMAEFGISLEGSQILVERDLAGHRRCVCGKLAQPKANKFVGKVG